MKWHRFKWWLLKVFVPWRYYREMLQEHLTEALHPDFGWIWRDEEGGGKYIAAARFEGWCNCLDAVRSSLKGYPNAGGDIEIMAEVDRIAQAHVVRNNVSQWQGANE